MAAEEEGEMEIGREGDYSRVEAEDDCRDIGNLQCIEWDCD